MYSSTLGLFAFKNCDTHSLQHTKQKKSLKMRESSPGECKVHYFKERLSYIALSTNAYNKKCFLLYRLTCSIFVLFKGFLFNCCCSLR